MSSQSKHTYLRRKLREANNSFYCCSCNSDRPIGEKVFIRKGIYRCKSCNSVRLEHIRRIRAEGFTA